MEKKMSVKFAESGKNSNHNKVDVSGVISHSISFNDGNEIPQRHVKIPVIQVENQDESHHQSESSHDLHWDHPIICSAH
jgi:hypothetical protein